MATAEQLNRFRSQSDGLVALARRDLRDFWSALDFTNPSLVRAAMLEFFPEIVAAYGDAAALIGADFYDELRNAPPSAASFRALLANPPEVEQAQGATRWGLGPLFQEEPDPAGALKLLEGAAQRLVLQAARSTIFGSATRDTVRTGFARVPRGVTCAFCTMVASRGFVYRTAETAGQSNQWHDDCDCSIVPGQNADDYPPGYDPDALYKLYKQGSGIGRDLPSD